jgi:hypothetical protein
MDRGRYNNQDCPAGDGIVGSRIAAGGLNLLVEGNIADDAILHRAYHVRKELRSGS